jgi:hypothetical protein
MFVAAAELSRYRGVPSLADLSETPSINGEHVVMIRLSQRPRKRLEPRQSASIFGRNERGCWFHRCFFKESPITQMGEKYPAEHVLFSTLFTVPVITSKIFFLHRHNEHARDWARRTTALLNHQLWLRGRAEMKVI